MAAESTNLGLTVGVAGCAVGPLGCVAGVASGLIIGTVAAGVFGYAAYLEFDEAFRN